MVNITLIIKHIDYPLDKILKGIPDGSRISPTLQRGVTRGEKLFFRLFKIHYIIKEGAGYGPMGKSWDCRKSV
jgi:hypothetical protein